MENEAKLELRGFDPDWFRRVRDVDGTEATTLGITMQFIEATKLDIIHLDMALAEMGLRPDVIYRDERWYAEQFHWNRLLSDAECATVVRGVEVCVAK